MHWKIKRNLLDLLKCLSCFQNKDFYSSSYLLKYAQLRLQQIVVTEIVIQLCVYFLNCITTLEPFSR